ncbi:MAG TPA: AAA family ATPase [Streptosporangiaceae bacterium]|nr:AAA family ATPase [Streptosporangiaceae bacterium]
MAEGARDDLAAGPPADPPAGRPAPHADHDPVNGAPGSDRPVAPEDAAGGPGDAEDYEPYLPPGPNPFSSVHPQGTPYRPAPGNSAGNPAGNGEYTPPFDRAPWPPDRAPAPPVTGSGDEQGAPGEPSRRDSFGTDEAGEQAETSEGDVAAGDDPVERGPVERGPVERGPVQPPANGQVPRPTVSPYPPLPEDEFDGGLAGAGQPGDAGASAYPTYTPYGPDDEIADDALTDYGLPSPQSYGYAPPPPQAEPLPDVDVPEPRFGAAGPSYRVNGSQNQDPGWRGEPAPSPSEPPADDEAPPAVSGRGRPAGGGGHRRGGGPGQHRAGSADTGLRGGSPADAGTAPPRNPAAAPPLSQAAPPLGQSAPPHGRPAAAPERPQPGFVPGGPPLGGPPLAGPPPGPIPGGPGPGGGPAGPGGYPADPGGYPAGPEGYPARSEGYPVGQDEFEPEPGAGSGHETSDSLTAEALLQGKRNAPGSGWRRTVYKATGGLVRVGESAGMQRRRELVWRARTPVAGGHHRVAVMSLKGGVGKTTTTVGLGATLATLRGDRVIAVDANPDRGTLSDKVRLETSATVRDLLNERQQVHRYADVRAFTSQASSRLEVLASDRDPGVSVAFSEADYTDVARVLEHYYSICITDCGTGLLHSAMTGVLTLADQIVLVSSPSVDGARSASATLDWLEAHGYGDLVRNAVVVLSTVRPRSKSTVDLDRLEQHFAARCRDVVRVPYDAHLEEGAEVELEQLSPATTEAYLRLAATVGDGFAWPRRALNRSGAAQG